MFHVGVPLCLFAALMLAAHRLWARRATVGCAAVAVVVFAASSVAVGTRHLDAGKARTGQALLAEFDAIAETIGGKTVWVAGHNEALQRLMKRRFMVDFLTAGSFVRYSRTLADPQVVGALDFVLAFERYPTPALLTPEHRTVFLYRGGASIGTVLATMGDARSRAYRRIEARAVGAVGVQQSPRSARGNRNGHCRTRLPQGTLRH